jgi:phage terminase small subunit
MARGPQRLGAFARELATGKRPYEAAIAAGYPDGSCGPKHAHKRAARADVKALVAELKAPIAEQLEITLAVLIERADQIYRQATLARAIQCRY